MLSGDAPRSVDDPDLEAATANIAMLPAATLLSSGAPRSEHDPDDAAAASIAMHQSRAPSQTLHTSRPVQRSSSVWPSRATLS